MNVQNRRRFLAGVGTVAVGGLAGCGGDGGDDDGGGFDADDYPTIDEWLTETTVGGAAGNYDGTLLDRRDQDTVTIDVGASGNDGPYAFDPPAVVVSPGTSIEWRWTGDGNPHNVEALPNEQIDESDYTFSSGDPVGGSGVQYTRNMDLTGVALYHCEPHLPLGMKGGIGVQ